MMSEQAQREETAKWYSKYHALRDNLWINLPIMATVCVLLGFIVGVFVTKWVAY